MENFFKRKYFQSSSEAERLQKTYIHLARQKGISQGRNEEKYNVALKMLEKVIEEVDIHEITTLSVDEISLLEQNFYIS